MKKLGNLLFGAFVLLFLAACVSGRKTSGTVKPLSGSQLGAADEFAFPPLAK